MSAIDTVVYDLGNVLIHWDPRNLYRQIFDDEARMEAFLAEVCTDAWNLEQDRGRTLAEATSVLIAQFPEHQDHIRAFYDRWHEMLDGANEPMVEVLRELKDRQTPLYALTNWSAETFPYALKHFPFLGWFDGIVVSGHEGLIKPDAAIYQCLLERYQLRADQCLFVDDSPRNIAGAENAGIAAFHFTGDNEAWRQQLRQHQLLN